MSYSGTFDDSPDPTGQPPPESASQAPAEQIVEIAGLGRRFLAYAIDFILLLFVSCGTGAVFAVVAAEAGANQGVADLANMCIGTLLQAVYFIAFWIAMDGQTPGKMAVGIRIIDDYGKPISGIAAVLRYIGYTISSVIFLLGFAWIVIDARRQGWHDKIASTYVVNSDVPLEGGRIKLRSQGSSGIGIALVGLGYLSVCGLVFALCALLASLDPEHLKALESLESLEQ